MNTYKSILKNAFFILAIFIAASGCDKINKPAMGAYPKDANPPGGPLKFYVAFDGTTNNPQMNGVDSIKANFPSSNTAASTDGVSGKAYKGSETSYTQFGSANDFTRSTSFTVAFWLKKTPQAAGKGTNFAFSLNAKDYSWTNIKMFLLFEDGGQSTVDAAACKFYLLDQWFEFVGDKRIPKLLNGQWHQLVFTYDETTSVLTPYVDGVKPTNLPADFGNVKKDGGPRGKLDFNADKAVTGFTIGGAGDVANKANGWMGNFDGQLDQFRLYGIALSAADVAALYASKL